MFLPLKNQKKLVVNIVALRTKNVHILTNLMEILWHDCELEIIFSLFYSIYLNDQS